MSSPCPVSVRFARRGGCPACLGRCSRRAIVFLAYEPWSTDMKALGFLYMVAGTTIAILVLRAAHGQWDEFGLIALYTAIPNAFTGLIAYFIFRRRQPELDIDKVLLVGCYIIGIGGGAYF